MEYLRVKNWEKFQHYKDRNPPWIKLHFELLASEDWVMLADASKLLMIVCMMIASRNNGMIPNDVNYIKRVAYLDKAPNIKPLIDCGFLLNPLADASASLADASTPLALARPETETETETERKPPIPPFEIPDWIDPFDWQAFMEVRKTKKAANTPRAKNSLVAELDRLRKLGDEPHDVIEKSIRSSWTDVYPLNGKQYGKSPPQPKKISPYVVQSGTGKNQ